MLAAGAVAKALEVHDAVLSGTLDAGHGVTAYWYGKHQAYSLFGTPPAWGWRANQMIGWMKYRGAVIKDFVMGLDLSPFMFLPVTQIIIFILGWPLEWTEIIVIFVPIFLPLLDHFGIDPLFFGLLIALNIQTSFLSPPVAMAPFYLKGVAPKGVSINDIFAGVMPFIFLVVASMVMLYTLPQIGMWLPSVLYGR